MRRKMSTRARRGFSMVELAIVIAVVGILAAVASYYVQPMLPAWRTRRAANEFAARVQLARQLAMSEGVRYRLRIEAVDADINTTSGSVGRYTLAAENATGSASAWDVLPREDDGADNNTGAGTFDISQAAPDGLPKVSMIALDPVPTDNSIFFTSRGVLDNPSSDFTADGVINVTFVNKAARIQGEQDEWTVSVNGAGMVRVWSNKAPAAMAGGSATTSSVLATTGQGYEGDGGWTP